MIKQEYDIFFEEVISIIQSHRIAAVQSVQSISNQLYWHIGELILQKQKEFAWGKSVVERLSLDLTAQLGGEISWSTRNLWFMRQLVAEYTAQIQTYSDQLKLTQLGSQSDKLSILNQVGSEFDIEKVKQLASQIPWRHNVLILQKVKTLEARLFYLQITFKNQYSRAVLLRTIGKPIGVAQYHLSKQLPKELQGKLPTMEDFKKLRLKPRTETDATK